MSEIGTWGDIIDAVDKEYFIGREQELEAFRQEISRTPPRKLLFFISGQGGVGKTALLNRYRELAQDLGFVVAGSDEQQRDVPTTLGKFAKQLADAGHKLERFAERYKKYRQRREEIEADPEAPQGLAAMLGRGVVRVGFVLSDGVPVVGKGLELIGRDVLETQASGWATYLAKKLTNKDEVALLRDPVPILSPLFFEDLNEVAQTRSILLCFDNFEFTRSYLDDWLLRLRDYGPSQNIRLAIAGRTPPGPTWDRLRSVVLHVSLDVFTPEEAENFLDTYGVCDLQRRQEILGFSGRLPVLMSWLASPEADEPDPTMPTADIVDRFLRWVKEPTLRRAALYAAIPYYFNLDVLTLLLDIPEGASAEAEFEWLQEMPFVSQRERGWQYHDVVRRYMLYYQRHESSRTYRSLHACLAEYYEVRRNELKLPANALWTNERWRQWTLEHAYHHLVASSDAHWPDFLSLFTLALRKRRAFARELIDLFLLPATRDELSKVQYEDAQLFADQLQAIRDGSLEDGLEMFERLCSTQGLSSQAQAYASAYRGEAHRLLKRFPEALTDFDRAIALDDQDAWAILSRGRTYRQMGHYDEALKDFERAIELDPYFEHEGQKEMGLVFRSLRKYQEAADAFFRALAAGPACAECWTLLARTYEALYPRAEIPRLLREVSVPDANTAPVIACRAEAMRRTRYLQEALKDFDRAIALDDEDARAITSRGNTYLRMKRYKEALADFDRALELKPDEAWIIASRGEGYQASGRYEEALADFDCALELEPELAEVIAGRGETYRLIKHYEEALADFDRAIELEPDFAWSILHRGQTYRQMGRYEEALADFERAIELDPDFEHEGQKEIGLVFRSSEKHQEAAEAFLRALAAYPACSECWKTLMGTYEVLYPEYEEALADFDRAIALDDKNIVAIVGRGRVYRQMKCYKEALADFDRAMALDETILDDLSDERGLMLSYLGRYAEAIETYEQGLKENPNDYAALYNMAVATARWKGLLDAQTQIETVRAVLQDLVDTDARGSALYGLGGLAALEGDADQALDYLREAISLEQQAIDWARHDIAWLDLRAAPRFQSLISETTQA